MNIKTVVVTGGAGNIAYSLVFRISEIYGKEQKIHLKLVDIDSNLEKLRGVQMELEDCFFPWLEKISCYGNCKEGFKDADIVLLVGAKPRGPGMERKDLLKDNGKIFKEQAGFLEPKEDLKVLVVGNPCNTNALMIKRYSKISSKSVMAMTMLDELRGRTHLRKKGLESSKVKVYGNHSPTMVVVPHGIDDIESITNTFMPVVQKRGAEIINARGASSAASAANAIINHMIHWLEGNTYFSAATYDRNDDIFFSTYIRGNDIDSIPVKRAFDEYKDIPEIVNKLKITKEELLKERNEIEGL